MIMFVAAPKKVSVQDLDFGERTTAGGIVLRSDNGKLAGIRSRWAKVYAVGDGIDDIKPGQWILIDHGRWSRTVLYEGTKLNIVDYSTGILLVSDHEPETFDTVGKN